MGKHVRPRRLPVLVEPARTSSGLRFSEAMFDMRSLPSAAAELTELTEQERQALRLVGEGLSPRQVAERLALSEDALYRLVAWALDELEPAPAGETMSDVHARHGTRPASPAEVAEFERRYGPLLAPDGEG